MQALFLEFFINEIDIVVFRVYLIFFQIRARNQELAEIENFGLENVRYMLREILYSVV